MPQLNETLLDLIVLNSFFFLYWSDVLSILDELDDDLLEFNNVTLLLNSRSPKSYNGLVCQTENLKMVVQFHL